MTQTETIVLDRFPLGIQSFVDLRKRNAIYVDKTDYVYKLGRSATKSYFLARPRRFGKSLLCTTLRAYFEGKKQLFEGLKIYDLETEWTQYPVLYIPLASGNFAQKGVLYKKLANCLDRYEKLYLGSTSDEDDLGIRLQNDVADVFDKTGLGTVFIVDEYDNPLINSKNLEEDIQQYRGFFSVLKDCDEYFRFVFLTGVTKFAKTSVFSGNNQPVDISFDAAFSAVCGITHKELEYYFSNDIQAFADKKKISYNEMVAQLKRWYDSYLFHEDGTKVFNPVSLFNALQKKDIQNYWYQTGTPTFLMQRLRSTNYDYRLLDGDVKYDKNRLINYKDGDFSELIPLLYYSGYLTIKSVYEDEIAEYTLGFPNNEVKISFLTNIIDEFYHSDIQSGFDYLDFTRDFRSGNVEDVMKRFQALFETLPYANDKNVTLIERDFQNVIFLVFSILGYNTISEPHFSKGRADVILINNDFVYIFEFKVDQDAQTALNQINIKNYAGRYNMDGRKIFKIGANFSSTEKNLTEWVVEEG